MKKLKKHLVVGIAVLFGMFVGACGVSNVSADQERPIKVWFENENGNMSTYCVVDELTGVNYIVVGGHVDGHADGTAGVAITPRLNADGSLYVTK